ncbi:MAG: hypothetical protein JWM44_2085 [Bacilli bacterium]|nr:hypothetical protein [Bacilli bacterium]
MSKLNRISYLVKFDGQYEEYLFRSWAINRAKNLREKNILSKVIYDEQLIYVWERLDPGTLTEEQRLVINMCRDDD